MSQVKRAGEHQGSTEAVPDGPVSGKIHFLKEDLEALQPRERRYFVVDDEAHGLALLVTERGAKSFYFRFKIRGVPRRLYLGPFPGLAIAEARRKATAARGQVSERHDPTAEEREKRGELTVGELVALYVEEHLRPNRKPKAALTAEQLTRDYLGDLVELGLSDLTRGRIKDWYVRALKRSKVRANRATEVLSAACWFALDREVAPAGWEKVSPCTRIKTHEEKPRKRVLTVDETGRLLRAIEAEHADLRDFFKMLLYTGARKANVQAMRWTDVDLDGGEWRIAADESKSGEETPLALIEDAVKLLRARKADLDALVRRAAKPVDAARLTLREAQHRAVEQRKAQHADVYVFPGLGATGHLVEPKVAWGRILKRANIQKLRIHDLRRTVGTRLADQGAGVFIIQKALGHKSAASSKSYVHPDLAVVRTALEGVAAAFAKARATAEADAGKVLPIKSARKAGR